MRVPSSAVRSESVSATVVHVFSFSVRSRAVRVAAFTAGVLMLAAWLALPVAAATPAVTVTVSPASSNLTPGASLSFTATVANSTDKRVTWTASSGTISSSGVFVAPSPKTAVTVTVTAASVASPKQKGTASIKISAAPTLQITSASLPPGTVGSAFSASLTAAGGAPPYTWALKAGQTLPGVTLNAATGAISGTPKTMGGYKPTFSVVDANKTTVSVTLALNIGVAPQPMANPALDMFGMHQLSRTQGAPSVAYGFVRLWDSQTGWSQINTAQGVYDFTKFDARLNDAKLKGADVLYNLGRTPVWAQCSTSTSSACTQLPDCSYLDSGAGQCYWPGDLNADGTGTNQHWKDWVTAVAMHAISLDPSQYAHVHMYEIWNEPNTKGNWRGTPAQLARLTQDAACIIKGTGCSQPGIDATAKIVGVPYVGGSTAIPNNSTAYLYTAGASQYVDAIAFHGYSTEPEDLLGIVSALRSVLSASDSAKPLYDTEVSWGLTSSITDLDERTGWVAKSVLAHWTAGVAKMGWYAWDGSGTMWSATQNSNCNTPLHGGFSCTTADAFTEVQNWIMGATLASPCSANGTVWSCMITRDGGYQGLVVWNTATRCSNGVCATVDYSVNPIYLHYRDLAGNSTQITGVNVPIGYKPILLENR